MSETLDIKRENDYLKDTIACQKGVIAALRSGTQPTDVQQLKAAIALVRDAASLFCDTSDYIPTLKLLEAVEQHAAV
jgi:hypothetical protein